MRLLVHILPVVGVRVGGIRAVRNPVDGIAVHHILKGTCGWILKGPHQETLLLRQHLFKPSLRTGHDTLFSLSRREGNRRSRLLGHLLLGIPRGAPHEPHEPHSPYESYEPYEPYEPHWPHSPLELFLKLDYLRLQRGVFRFQLCNPCFLLVSVAHSCGSHPFTDATLFHEVLLQAVYQLTHQVVILVDECDGDVTESFGRAFVDVGSIVFRTIMLLAILLYLLGTWVFE